MTLTAFWKSLSGNDLRCNAPILTSPCRLAGVVMMFLLASANLFGQDSTLALPADSIRIVDLREKPQKEHSVAKAAIASALLPGAGQAYNRKYWKIPIIYAAFGGLGYAIQFNAKRYKTYRHALLLRNDDDSSTIDKFEGIYTDNDLVELKNFYRRNLDLSILFTTLVYTLNILDATVDAHLFTFDISDDLSLHFDPALHATGTGRYHPSLRITFRL